MEIPNFRPIIVYKITSDANNEPKIRNTIIKYFF